MSFFMKQPYYISRLKTKLLCGDIVVVIVHFGSELCGLKTAIHFQNTFFAKFWQVLRIDVDEKFRFREGEF